MINSIDTMAEQPKSVPQKIINASTLNNRILKNTTKIFGESYALPWALDDKKIKTLKENIAAWQDLLDDIKIFVHKKHAALDPIILKLTAITLEILQVQLDAAHANINFETRLEHMRKNTAQLDSILAELKKRKELVVFESTKQALDVTQTFANTVEGMLNITKRVLDATPIERKVTNSHTKIFSKDNILKEQITENENKEWLDILSDASKFLYMNNKNELAEKVDKLIIISIRMVQLINKNAVPNGPDKQNISEIETLLTQIPNVSESYKKNVQDQLLRMTYRIQLSIDGTLRALKNALTIARPA